MVMPTVQMGEYVQTMGREVAAVVFAKMIASVIVLAIWQETVPVTVGHDIVKRIHWQGPKESASSSERRGTCSWIRWW
jgi:hypothetical protein